MSTRTTTIHRRDEPKRLQRTLMALGALLLMAILLALVVDRIFFPSTSTHVGEGSGIAATQARPLPPFTRIDLAGANNLNVEVGSTQSVIVHADSNLLGRVTTRVRSGRLVVANTPGNLSAKTPMFVVVSVPSLDGIRLQGAGNISVTGIDSRNLTVALPGAGNIAATGTTTNLRVMIGGEGNASLRQLVAHDATAALIGSGSIMLTATHRLSARISGSGTIFYGGNPAHVTQKVSGSGAIIAE